MEAVSWFAREPHSDRPKCADSVLTNFGMKLNDRFTDDERQLLRPLIPLLVGTAGSMELRRKRSFYLVDFVIRQITPLAMDATNQPELAAKLRGIGPITDTASARAAHAITSEVRRASAYASAYASSAYAYASSAYASAAAASDAYSAYASASRVKIVEMSIAALRGAIEITE
jgi:hypothetical protein